MNKSVWLPLQTHQAHGLFENRFLVFSLYNSSDTYNTLLNAPRGKNDAKNVSKDASTKKRSSYQEFEAYRLEKLTW